MPTTSGMYVDQDRAVATGNVVFRQGNNQIAADRADFNTKTRLGTFYNASGFATVQPPTPARRPGRRGASADDGTGHGRLLLRRDGREDRPAKIQDHQRRLHDLRPADAAMEFRRRHDRAQPRSLHAAAQRGDDGQGRAACSTCRRSTTRQRGRTAPPDFSSPRTGRPRFEGTRFTTRSSGRSIAARTRRSCTTGSRRRARASAANTGTTSAADRMATSAPISSTRARPRRMVCRPCDRTRSYRINAAVSELLPWRLRARASVDYFSDIGTNQTFNTEHQQFVEQPAAVSAATWSARGATYSLNGTLLRSEYFSSQSISNVSGSWPRVNRESERTARRRHAALRLRQR